MKIVAICCLLSGLAGADLFPPEGSIVLTQDKSVQLRWDRPTERLVVFENEQPLLDTGVRGTQHTLTVKPGSSYRWVAGTAQGRFSVARQWEYRADAPEGSGQSGKAVAVRLERQGPEMHMTLECGSDRKLYVFPAKAGAS